MLKLYNSLTRKIETFRPRQKGNVKLVTCGPSIYQLPHIGNYRTFVFEDILQRYLEYLSYNVKRVLTITDIEDKALAEAKKQNMPLKKLTDKNIKQFVEELKKLKVKIPDLMQRSSDCIERAVELINILLEKGYAYWFTHEGRRNIYFNPLKVEDFGKLFRLDMSKWPKKKVRFHKDTYTGRRWNRGDFILWHGFKEGDKIYWETRIGKGRPSWNIQDPSMIPKHFGFKVDVWCSGIDSIYRHHDYIIAIVESITTNKPFVRYWLHAAHLIFEGEKMSKRKGNIKYPRNLLETECIWSHIRFFFVYDHYRRELDFTFKKYSQVCRLLKSFREMVKKLIVSEGNQQSSAEAKRLVKRITSGFEENMNNDLHVEDAFDSLYETVEKLVKLKEKKMLNDEDIKKILEKLKAVDYVLQSIF